MDTISKLSSECGFMYIAFGEKFRIESVASAKSLKNIHPDARITVVTDKAMEENVFEQVIVKDAYRSYMDKVANMKLSPYQQTMFLDTDTYICDDIKDVFGLLKYYDICMSPEVGRPYWENLPEGLQELKECNTGVIIFNKSQKTQELFSNWEATYIKRENIDFHDQTSMAIALAQTDVKYGLLPSEYNLRANHCQVLARKVKIIHARCRNYQSMANHINTPVDVGRNWLPSVHKCVPFDGVGLSRIMNRLKLKIAPVTKRIRRAFKKEGDIVMSNKKRFES